MHEIRKDVVLMPRYLLVGGASGLMDTTVFAAMMLFAGEGRHMQALVVAAVCAFMVNFPGHRFITFRGTGAIGWKLAIHFLFKAGVFSLRLFLMYFVVDVYGHSAWVAYIIGAVLVICTYLGTRWIFTHQPPWQLAVAIYRYLTHWL